MQNRWQRAKARPRSVLGQMNKTEAAYAEVLSERILLGEIAGYQYEPLKLRLADNTFYTPDFMVQTSGGEIEFHEVKACMSSGKMLCEDDAKVKIKVAAEAFPMFGFVMAGKLPKKAGGGWKFIGYGGGGE